MNQSNPVMEIGKLPVLEDATVVDKGLRNSRVPRLCSEAWKQVAFSGPLVQ